MSVCQVDKCGIDWNIWKVSNNANVPRYQDCSVCNECLHVNSRFTEAQVALVKGRFNRQNENIVSYGSWRLEKDVNTWKEAREGLSKCNLCDRTQNIWLTYMEAKALPSIDSSDESNSEECSGEYKYMALCDEHLHLAKFGSNPLIRIFNNNYGISTEETSWTCRPEELISHVAPLKKRKGK